MDVLGSAHDPIADPPCPRRPRETAPGADRSGRRGRRRGVLRGVRVHLGRLVRPRAGRPRPRGAGGEAVDETRTHPARQVLANGVLVQARQRDDGCQRRRLHLRPDCLEERRSRSRQPRRQACARSARTAIWRAERRRARCLRGTKCSNFPPGRARGTAVVADGGPDGCQARSWRLGGVPGDRNAPERAAGGGRCGRRG